MDGAAGATDQPEPREARGDSDLRTLRQRQALFVKCLGLLIEYAYSAPRYYELTMGEGYVMPSRRTRKGDMVEDGVHMVGSLHYDRLACDLNLFVRGSYITDGGHYAWRDLGLFWEGLDPLCTWGGRFHDSNHVSVTWMGRK